MTRVVVEPLPGVDVLPRVAAGERRGGRRLERHGGAVTADEVAVLAEAPAADPSVPTEPKQVVVAPERSRT